MHDMKKIEKCFSARGDLLEYIIMDIILQYNDVVGSWTLKNELDILEIHIGTATLGFSEIIRAFIAAPMFDTITNGSYGLKSIPGFPNIFAVFGLAALCIALMVLLINSSYGRAFKSIREDEVAAQSMGKVSFWSDDVPVEGPRREIINETMVFGRIPYPVTCLSIGNPHCVILMDEISKDLVCRIGRYSESARQFPEKINTQIMKVLDRTHIQTEVYERGAGYTLASGSGCCAAAAAAYRLGLTDPKMFVQMPGGTLELEIDGEGVVHMTGDVGYVGAVKLGSHFTEQLRALK